MSALETKKQDLQQPKESAPNPAEKEMAAKDTAATNKPAQEMTPEEKHLKELHDNRHEKKGARFAFHFTNFTVWHVLFNSTLSVILTYSVLPTKFASSAITWMERSFVGKAAHHVFSLPGKAVDVFLPEKWKTASKLLTEEQKVFEARHSARSSVEAMLMCIAGFFALAPVYFYENNRAGILNYFDNLFHPGRTPKEKEAAKLKPEDEPRETVANLLRARFVGLAAVFTTDRLQQNFNNVLMRNNKPNADTWAWKFGVESYENMNPGVRSWLANFFSRKNVTLAGIGAKTRDDLLNTINSPEPVKRASKEMADLQNKLYEESAWNNPEVRGRLKKQIEDINQRIVKSHPKDVERAVFGEQSRLLITKELWLTLVVSTVIYASAKSETMARIFEAIGLKKKENHSKPKQEAPAVPDEATQKNDESQKQWSAKEEKREAKKEKAASFADAATQSQNQGVAATLG